MKRFIFGFQRRVWWPKWTPASSSWRMVTTAKVILPWSTRLGLRPLLAHGRRSWGCRVTDPLRWSGHRSVPRRQACVVARDIPRPDRTIAQPNPTRPRGSSESMPDHTAISGDALGDPTGRGSSQPMPDHTAISGDTLGDPTGRAAR